MVSKREQVWKPVGLVSWPPCTPATTPGAATGYARLVTLWGSGLSTLPTSRYPGWTPSMILPAGKEPTDDPGWLWAILSLDGIWR